jgi:hypothetical protein
MRRTTLAIIIVMLFVSGAATLLYGAAKAQGYASIKSDNFVGAVQTTMYITVVDKFGHERTIVLTPSYRQYAVWTPVSEAEEGTQITSITVTLDILTWGVALKSNAWGYYNVTAQVNCTLRRWNSYTTAKEAMKAFYAELDRGKSEDEAFAYVTGMLGQWGSWSENYYTQSKTYSANSLRYRSTQTFSFTIPNVLDADKEWAMEMLFGWKVTAVGIAVAGNQVTAGTEDIYLAKPENEAYILKLQIIRTEWGWLSISVTVGLSTSAWVPPQLYSFNPTVIDVFTKILALIQMALATVLMVRKD